MKHEVAVYQQTERVGENRVGRHEVFTARWLEGDDEATFHTFKVRRSHQYGYHTVAGAMGRMDVGDVIAEAARAARKGLEVFCGPVPEMEVF
jgi:hypothetical protein